MCSSYLSFLYNYSNNPTNLFSNLFSFSTFFHDWLNFLWSEWFHSKEFRRITTLKKGTCLLKRVTGNPSWRIWSLGGNCDSRKKDPFHSGSVVLSPSVPRRALTIVSVYACNGMDRRSSKQAREKQAARQAGRQAGGQATWYALAAESERSEVTIDANLSECHVSAAAGTQYTHAMDDNGTAGRSTIPLNPCLLHPYIYLCD